jgi:hypothetical protein
VATWGALLVVGSLAGWSTNQATPPSSSKVATAPPAIIGVRLAPAGGAAGSGVETAAGTIGAGATLATGCGGTGAGATTIVASESASGAAPICAAAPFSACAKSTAVSKRWSGRFAIAFATTASNAGGAVTERSEGRGGWTFSALCMIADMLPSNGRSPVSSW